MARRKVLLQMCVTMGLLLTCIGEETTTKETKTQTIRNPHLDIALLYDQSNTLRKELDKTERTWNGIQEWIDYYKNSTAAEFVNQTRFAVVGCGDASVVLNLNGSGVVQGKTMFDKILTAQQKVRSDALTHEPPYPDNVHGCADTTTFNVFNSKMGDRSDAENIVLFISDCVLFNTPDTLEPPEPPAMKKLREKVNKFLFVCSTNDTSKRTAAQEAGYKTIMKWMDNDANSVYYFSNTNNLITKLNEYLPKTNLTYCKVNSSQPYSYTKCKLNSKKRCSKTKYPNIIERTNPSWLPPCPSNRSKKCNITECPISSTLSAATSHKVETGTTLDDDQLETNATVSAEVSSRGKITSTSSYSRPFSTKESSTGVSASITLSTSVSESGKGESVATTEEVSGKSEESSAGGPVTEEPQEQSKPSSENSTTYVPAKKTNEEEGVDITIILGAVIGSLMALIIIIVLIVVVVRRRSHKKLDVKEQQVKVIIKGKRANAETFETDTEDLSAKNKDIKVDLALGEISRRTSTSKSSSTGTVSSSEESAYEKVAKDDKVVGRKVAKPSASPKLKKGNPKLKESPKPKGSPVSNASPKLKGSPIAKGSPVSDRSPTSKRSQISPGSPTSTKVNAKPIKPTSKVVKSSVKK